MHINTIFNEIENEVQTAELKFPRMNTYHEGYAVILEELDELWDEVKRWPKTEDTKKIKKECIQIASMAIRFIRDLLPDETNNVTE